MPGFPRDLAVLEPWELSLLRSRERGRARYESCTGNRSGKADESRLGLIKSSPNACWWLPAAKTAKAVCF